MIKLYNIITNDDTLKRFNENENGIRFSSVTELREKLDVFSDRLNNILSGYIDNILKESGINSDIEDILASDRIFYRKITSRILPDEPDEEAASKTILDIFLLIKEDNYYEPTEEQVKILIKVMDYFDISSVIQKID